MATCQQKQDTFEEDIVVDVENLVKSNFLLIITFLYVSESIDTRIVDYIYVILFKDKI